MGVCERKKIIIQIYSGYSFEMKARKHVKIELRAWLKKQMGKIQIESVKFFFVVVANNTHSHTHTHDPKTITSENV